MIRKWNWTGLGSVVLGLSLLLVSFSPPPLQAQAYDGFTLIINQVDSSAFPEITAYISVLDQYGLPVDGLAQADFQITEDVTQLSTFTMTSMLSSTEPAALAVALDLSSSLREQETLSALLVATNNLIDQLRPADEIALIAIRDQAETVVPLSKDKARARSAVSGFTAQGESAVWDGVHAAITALALRPSGRRAVIVVTDGQDTRSQFKLEDVRAEAVRQRLPVFVMGFGQVNEAALTPLAGLTGGQAFIQPDFYQVAAKFGDILGRLRQQYVVRYSSRLSSDGAEHRLTARANFNGLQAENQKAFVAGPVAYTLTLPSPKPGDPIGVGMAMRLEPQFSERAAIASVEYALDGVTLATQTASPFVYDWTPAKADLGAHALVLRSVDKAGQPPHEISVPIEVVPAVQVTITAPREKDVILGQTSFQAKVEGPGKVASIDYVLDGMSVGTATDKVSAIPWDSALVPAGDHTLKVKVTDVNGQSDEKSVTFHVQVGIGWGVLGALLVVLVSLGVMVPLGVRFQRGRSAKAKPALAQAVAPTASVEAGLVLEAGPGQGQQWILGPGETRLGRQRSENEVVLLAQEVSRKQALVRNAGGVFTFVNLSQSLPSLVNGLPVAGEQRLADGDRIQIGEFVLRFIGPARVAGA